MRFFLFLLFFFLFSIFFSFSFSPKAQAATELFCAACSTDCGPGFADCLYSDGSVKQKTCNNGPCSQTCTPNWTCNTGPCDSGCGGSATYFCNDGCGHISANRCTQPACPTPTPAPGSLCASVGGSCTNISNCKTGQVYGVIDCTGGNYCCQVKTPEDSCIQQGGTCKSSCTSFETVVANCSSGNVCCKPQGRTTEICNTQGTGWNPSSTCVALSTCTTTATPTPVPTPVTLQNCTAGKSCQSCGAACGTALKDCTYNEPKPCIETVAPGEPCGNCPSQAQSCVANRCLDRKTVSGNIFIDSNVNSIKDAGETNYTGEITVTSSDGTVPTVAAGLYTFLLTPNASYTIRYTNLPAGYTLTYPTTGPPPFFNVSVGVPCSVGGSNSASCDVNGSISNLNFGITNNKPWFQCQAQDCRIDSGFTSKVPLTAIGGAYASIAGSGGTPGLIFSGSTSPDFGQGQASSTGWVAGGLSYPENYSPPKVGGQVKTSYNFLSARAAQGNITAVDIAPFCSGGLNNCTLTFGANSHGIYRANGNLNLNAFTFPANQDFVILVNGILTINGRVAVPVGSTAIFASTGNIIIDQNVGEAAASSASPTLQGIYSADQSFIINGTNNCTTGADLRINIAGTVITNAGSVGGSFQNNRDLCSQDPFYPTVQFQERADFILNTPAFLKVPNFTYQEIAP